MGRKAWVAEEAEVSFWEIDALGIIQPNPTIESYCQNVTVKPLRQVMKKRQPGCAYEETRAAVIAHEITIGRVFFKKSSQLTPLQDKSKRWRVLIQLVNPRYSGSGDEVNDERDFRYCIPTEGPDMAWQDGTGKLVSAVTLAAEWEA